MGKYFSNHSAIHKILLKILIFFKDMKYLTKIHNKNLLFPLRKSLCIFNSVICIYIFFCFFVQKKIPVFWIPVLVFHCIGTSFLQPLGPDWVRLSWRISNKERLTEYLDHALILKSRIQEFPAPYFIF